MLCRMYRYTIMVCIISYTAAAHLLCIGAVVGMYIFKGGENLNGGVLFASICIYVYDNMCIYTCAMHTHV